jgi:DNA-binding MarR family transcriptional regulator
MQKVKSVTLRSNRDSEAASARRFDSLEQEAYLNLWRTYDRLKAFEEGVFAAHELSAQQYNALRLLEEAAPDSMPTLMLAARLISRAPDITRLVDRLEERGLVRRERQLHNRRVVRIAITPQGSSLLTAMAEQVVECGRRQLGHLPADELHTLIGLLKEARRPHEQVLSVSPPPSP